MSSNDSSNQWISINDRLPENNGKFIDEVLLHMFDHRGNSQIVIGYYQGDSKFVLEYEVVTDASDFTHWMPLPEPPTTH